MKQITRLTMLMTLLSTLSFANTWVGVLVDSRCYEFREHNTNAKLTDAERDTNEEIRYCSATPKTKTFSLVQRFGPAFALDSKGNAKAAEFVSKTGKKPLFIVVISGTMSETNTIEVDSISLGK